jgi:uncharacterized protein (TIGR02117 family)
MLLGISLSFLLSGCLTMPPATQIPVDKPRHIIYFAYHHWHTSVIVEVSSFAKHHPKLIAHLNHEHQKFVRFGWGDGDYFTGKSKTVGTAAKALIASSYSAIQMLSYSEPELHEIPRDSIVPLAISEEGLRQLVTYLDNSIAKNKQGDALPLSAMTVDAGIFFQANGHYGVFNNCNTWSGRALRAAGLPVANRLTLTAKGVFEQAQKISAFQHRAGVFKDLYPANLQTKHL